MSRNWSWTAGSSETESCLARSFSVPFAFPPAAPLAGGNWTTSPPDLAMPGAPSATIDARLSLGGFDMRQSLRTLLDPSPELANFGCRRSGGIELGDALAETQRVLVIVAHDDVDLGQDAEHREAVRGVAHAVAARRGLVEHECEHLL